MTGSVGGAVAVTDNLQLPSHGSHWWLTRLGRSEGGIECTRWICTTIRKNLGLCHGCCPYGDDRLGHMCPEIR